MGDDTSVESILIPKSYGYEDAILWLRVHEYVCINEEHLPAYFKFRLQPKERFNYFTTRKLESGFMFIIGHIKKRYDYPSGEYKPWLKAPRMGVNPNDHEDEKEIPVSHIGPSCRYDSDPSERGINDYLFRE